MTKTKILVVDDDPAVLETCGLMLRDIPDSVVVLEQESLAAAELLASERFDLLVTDVRMPGIDGVQLLETARQKDPELSALVLTAYPTVETAIRCLKLGATDYITKPIDTDELIATVQRIVQERRLLRENSLLTRHVERPYSFTEFVGRGAASVVVKDLVRKVAASNVDVLITGETGVGKELVARSIHQNGWRRDGHFVPVDCSAIPESLMESELFGHERGAYTSADRTKMGLLEFADGGTLFLDEIGELPSQLQPKFLRVLQERRFRRVGGREEIAVNVRVVAATNRDLPTLIRERRFREDLYYRLKVAQIDVPPLRERSEDIPLLVSHFVERCAKEMDRPCPTVEPEALDLLSRHAWPGNVRELHNTLRFCMTMISGSVLTVDDLPDEIATLTRSTAPPATGGFFDLREKHIAKFEKTYLQGLLEAHKGDVTEAAGQAQLPRGTLYRLFKKHGLIPDQYRT